MRKKENQNQSNVNMFKTSSVFTYLGIKITPKVEDIVIKNYDVFDNAAKSIERWTALPISVIGRINI